MQRSFTLRVPGSSSAFTPDRTKTYKLTPSGYFVVASEADADPGDMLLPGSKADDRRIDALEANVTRLFTLLRSTSPSDTDTLLNALTAFRARGLSQGRLITLSGDALGGASFDGTTNSNINVSLSNSGVLPGFYSFATIAVDAKGRVVSASSGNPPAGSFALTGDVLATGMTGTTIAATLATLGTSGTYNQVVTDNKGRVISGTFSSPLPFVEEDTLDSVVRRGSVTTLPVTTGPHDVLGTLTVIDNAEPDALIRADTANLLIEANTVQVVGSLVAQGPLAAGSTNVLLIEAASVGFANRANIEGVRIIPGAAPTLIVGGGEGSILPGPGTIRAANASGTHASANTLIISGGLGTGEFGQSGSVIIRTAPQNSVGDVSTPHSPENHIVALAPGMTILPRAQRDIIGPNGFLTEIGTDTAAAATLDVALLASNGAIVATSFAATSDERLKAVEGPIAAETGLAFVENAQPVAYRFLSDPATTVRYGWLAQQVAKSGFNQVVSAVADPELRATMDVDGFRSPAGARLVVDDSQVIALLHVALKDALRRIALLESK